MENRYEKYKDSGIAWIGEIPEHWEAYQLKRCSKFINGYAFNSNCFSKDAGIPVIRIGDILSDKVSFENIVFVQENKEFEKFIAQKNDILIAMSGATVGKIGIYKAETKAYINQRVGIIRAEQYNFIKRMFTTHGFIDYVSLSSAGSAQPNISSDGILNFFIPIPPIIEQQSIATYLDQKCGEIDELITLQEEMITKLQSYKQSVITEAVTRSLDKNAPLKDSGVEWIGKIPAHWICAVFKKFLLEPMQYGANEPAEECNYNDPRYIRITDIKDDGTLRDDTFKSLSLDKAKEYMLVKGDLLFARSGATVGKTFLYNEDYTACFAGYLIKARCNKNELIPNFVFYYTLSNVYQNWKNSIFIQSTIQNIGADKYSLMPIIVPPIHEQQTIANYLDQKCSEIDELISIKQQKIEKLKDYKKSLIFECVTGKRKV